MEQAITFVDNNTGKAVAFDDQDIALEDVFVGNVLTRHDGVSKMHYRIVEAEHVPEEPARVEVATSDLRNVVIVLGTLTATWFLLDWAFRLFAG